MKKTLITFFLLTAVSMCCFSQTEFSIGLKGGLNSATLAAEHEFYTNHRTMTRVHFGAFALLRGKRLGFQPEIIYSQQGSEFGHVTYESKFDYLNFPLMAKLYLFNGVSIEVGPQFGILTSAERDTTKGVSGGGEIVTKKNMKKLFEKFEYSLAVGLGWDLPGRLNIDVRYNLGLSEINDKYITYLQWAGYVKPSWKNRVWQFSVGYKLFRNKNE